MEDQAHKLPRPYLTHEEVNERLEDLGFHIDDALDFPPGYQKKKFVALQELIAGAIADFTDVEDDEPPESIEEVNQELLHFVEVYLVRW